MSASHVTAVTAGIAADKAAVAIDGVIKLSGRIPKPDEVKAWLE